MDRDWSEKSKEIRVLLTKKATCKAGVERLVRFRREMFEQIGQIAANYPEEAFYQMPFAGAEGFRGKTLAYLIWHIFRTEDIVAHEMIAGDRQVFFARGFREAVRAPLITTGDELSGSAAAKFSKALDIEALYRYAQEVTRSTERILTALEASDLKRRFGDGMREKLLGTGCVSADENGVRLIGDWCGKDVAGLIKTQFCRQWVAQIEAMRRIKNRLCKMARKGVDPVAYCGLSCNHCFLAQWCGSCRTAYNVCSFATCSPGGVCPNAECCRKKGVDGCYACDCLEDCEKGFYAPTNGGANAAKAQALYIRKHGKKAFLQAHGRLREKMDYAGVQELLDREGMRILEEA